MEQVLYKLPDGWEWKRIEDIFTITSGKNLTKKDMHDEGEFPVYGGNGIAGRYNDFNLSGSNIIIGRVGALCGNVRLVNSDIWVTDNAFFIKEYKVDILKEYLAKVLSTLNLGATANKAAQPVISYKGIKDLVIPYPPLDEQKRIVEKLDALLTRIDTAIEHLQESITLADALYASELNEVFPSDADIESLSDKAGWVSLSDICTFENGDRGKNYPSKSAFVAEGIPVVSAGNLGERYIDHKGLNYITPERYDLLRSGRIKIGDILFCLRGSLGKVAISKDIDEGVIASSLVIIRPKACVSAEYIYKYLKSSLCQQFISFYNNGAAQPNLSAKSLGKFMLPLPNADEQKIIIDGLDEKYQHNQKLLDALRDKIDSLKILKASILDSAFKGEL
ncbi:TPA: restriction endonuclease subunit S [Vibrio parahaemolyticus]|nr:restriction endonuclease subunit S [Vibrio parahaemolyticus]HCG6770243.1 restriction endonuclease subunit S [Vibrio parahaemolyticus]